MLNAIIQELYAENTIVIKRETNRVSKFVIMAREGAFVIAQKSALIGVGWGI